MNPAPNVAIPTPMIKVKVSGCFRNTNPISTVKTTYRLVKNAETAGVISFNASIWVRKPPNINNPRSVPPFHTFLSTNPIRALSLNIGKDMAATRNLMNIMKPTTDTRCQFSRWVDAESRAFFIQTNVAPHIRVTNINHATAFRLSVESACMFRPQGAESIRFGAVCFSCHIHCGRRGHSQSCSYRGYYCTILSMENGK